LLAKRDFHLQTGNLGYKTGLSFTNGESWVTNGILGLLFTGAKFCEYCGAGVVELNVHAWSFENIEEA
jgi:hypothetical protein